MSRFSGKCDFHDEIVIMGLEHILNSEVYVGNSSEPLKLTCLADCVPYYPYVVSIAHHDNVKKCGFIAKLQIFLIVFIAKIKNLLFCSAKGFVFVVNKVGISGEFVIGNRDFSKPTL